MVGKVQGDYISERIWGREEPRDRAGKSERRGRYRLRWDAADGRLGDGRTGGRGGEGEMRPMFVLARRGVSDSTSYDLWSIHHSSGVLCR